MVQSIFIGGKDRPILFGFGALYHFEKATGKKPFEEFNKLSGNAGDLSVVTMVELFMAGFRCAAPGGVVNFSESDLAGWLSEPGVIEKIQKLFVESMPQGGDDDSAEKKAKGEA